MSKKILVIDDETSILDSLAGILTDEGFKPLCVASAEEGLERLKSEAVDLVLLDIWMPGMDGIEALKLIKAEHPELQVIMISGHGTIETAVQATKIGAFDFIEKPLSYDKIFLAINNGLRFSSLEAENLILRQKTERKPSLTGNSPAIQQLKEQIERVAPTDAWVLIRGEHGTGKELVAQTIHRLSARSNKPMVEVNCAAIPEELIESELFGHEKGSFTGAQNSKRGKFDQADRGMLFLDEIGDMSMKTQAKILRILQEQTFERVGGNQTIQVDVRVLAATNKNLEEEIDAGNFRADLFWRLNVVPIHLPLLNQRTEDIPLLVKDFVEDFSRKGLGRKSFTKDALAIMKTHTWPGNVRELRNFVERLVIMCPDDVINGRIVEQYLHQAPGTPVTMPDSSALAPYHVTRFKEAKQAFEREYIKDKLQENNGNISQTAEILGLERSHLHKKIKTLNIDLASFSD
ncbi:MAG: sigma-54-dependent Fis family transcriptional regulator [Deltaproteobacteria bacterium]|jgi:two-component system nitrogen regulation response regulator NtrX|nr:sigma-54-dependent Fis family transcriptional regulator [Deltaproteobacteria bacterium]